MKFDVLAHVRNIVLAVLFLIRRIELAHQHQNISINRSRCTHSYFIGNTCMGYGISLHIAVRGVWFG